MVSNSIYKLKGSRKLPVMIVNTINKPLTYKRNCPVARVENVTDQNSKNINEVISEKGGNITNNLESEIKAPKVHMLTIQSLINQNTELFAAKASDLGHTDTVTMRIDTGNQKLRPCRTQLNNRPVIDKAIDEMMEAGMIRR